MWLIDRTWFKYLSLVIIAFIAYISSTNEGDSFRVIFGSILFITSILSYLALVANSVRKRVIFNTKSSKFIYLYFAISISYIIWCVTLILAISNSTDL